MNKKQKGSILISAIASIAFAGSVLVGGTYALFTSESTTNIAVTSGTVNVEATASDLWVYSPTSISSDEGNEILDDTNAASVITQGVSGRFYNGGVATLNASEGVVTLDKMTPGDKATFKITITNKSNVKTKYRTVIKKIDPTDDVLFEALDFNIGGLTPEVATVWQNLKAPETEGGEVVTTYNCKVELPTTISGSEYMDKKCTIQVLVEAIQGNAYTSDDNGTTIASDDINSSTDSIIMNGDSKEESTIVAEVPAGSTDATKLTLVKEPTDVPGSIIINTGGSAISTDVKLIDQDGNTVVAKNDKYFTITIDLGKNLDVVSFYHNSVELTQADSLSSLTEVNLFYYDSSSGKVTFTTTDFSVFTLEVKFAGGLGTEEAPYLIENAENFKALNDEYSKGKFNYYKVADSVETLDLTGISNVALYGVFDGNNKTITTNCSVFYFTYSDENSPVMPTIKNLTVIEINSVGALVGYVGSDVINFENVKISGVIERNYHGAAFVGYGTLSFGSNFAKDYTLNFKNCSVDAIIITRGEGNVAILVGHSYQGSDHTVTINLDNATDKGIESAILRAKATAVGYKYYAVGSRYEAGVDVYVDGVKKANGHEKFNATSLGTTAPLKSDDGYTFKVDAGVSTLKVQILSQLTAYDEDGNVIARLNGITNTNGTCYNETVNEGDTVTVFDKITSVVIEKGLTSSGYPEYRIDNDGKLTILTNDTDNYLTGTIRLAAYQYDENGALISSGVLDIASSSGSPASGEIVWNVK